MINRWGNGLLPFSTEPSTKPMLLYCQLNPNEQTSMKLKYITRVYIKKKEFENFLQNKNFVAGSSINVITRIPMALETPWLVGRQPFQAVDCVQVRVTIQPPHTTVHALQKLLSPTVSRGTWSVNHSCLWITVNCRGLSKAGPTNSRKTLPRQSTESIGDFAEVGHGITFHKIGWNVVD